MTHEYTEPDRERVQALADISRSALRCHSNETRSPIANLPNSAQLDDTPYRPPTYIRVRAGVSECGEGQEQRDTQTAVTTIHFALATPHVICNELYTCNINTLTQLIPLEPKINSNIRKTKSSINSLLRCIGLRRVTFVRAEHLPNRIPSRTRKTLT